MADENEEKDAGSPPDDEPAAEEDNEVEPAKADDDPADDEDGRDESDDEPQSAGDDVGEQPLIEDGSIRGVSPLDEKALTPVETTSPDTIGDAVKRAAKAQQEHSKRSVEVRARMLRKLKDEILFRAEELVAALRKETGKPEAEAWLHEVVPTADLAQYWSLEGPQLLAADEPHLSAMNYPGKRAVVERTARGVVAVITPWNFPVALPLRTLFPALLAGNAVLLKPSEHAPRCAAILEQASRAVFGKDLVQVLQGGADVGAALVQADIDAVVFTGSVNTGKKVARAAADALLPVSLELGGKDAAVVLDDANLERTANGILWGAFANSGQNCAAIERVYATPGVAKELRAKLAAKAKELEPGRDFGPLSNRAQLQVVERHVEAAVEDGAKVLCGGSRLDREGFWHEPTVLSGPSSDSIALAEETFGPVVPVIEVADEEAAIEAANASSYGLTASVWTRNVSRGEKLARRLNAGVVMVNNHGFTGAIPSLPWTGVKASGYGVTNSPHALSVLTRPRAVVVDMRRAKKEMWWHPYTPALVTIGRSMAVLQGGRSGIGAKIKAVFSLLGAFLKRWKT